MHSRCERKSDPAYARYGAIGVRVCKAWRSFPAFQSWAQQTRGKPGQALVLGDRKRAYGPSNCSWGTPLQASGVGLTAFGETKPAEVWARDPRAAVNAQTIRDRVRDGVPPEEAISAKVARHGKRKNSRRRRTIDWDRVAALRDLPVAMIAKRLRRSVTAVRDGMRERGWYERPQTVRELKYGKRLYGVWASALRRFGSLGWSTFGAFHTWAIESGYRPGLFLTRPERGRPPGLKNALWLPMQESLRYYRPYSVSRKSSRPIRAFGETKSAVAWSQDPRCRVTTAGLLARLYRGLEPTDAITKPKRWDVEYRSKKAIEAWGVEKSIAAWARDRRARVAAGTIALRMREGWRPEDAISVAAFGSPRRARDS